MGLLYGPHEVLDVAARVPLRPLVELLRPPLGLLAGREARNLPLLEEHYRNHPVARFFHAVLTLPLAHSAYRYHSPATPPRKGVIGTVQSSDEFLSRKLVRSTGS